MNWTDGPATWKQLRYLSHHGYKPDHVTKTEASQLIRKFGGDPEAIATVAETEVRTVRQPDSAYDLRLKVENARRSIAESGKWESEKRQGEFALAIAKRQEFWLDTCGALGKGVSGSQQAQELYQKNGCRFVGPTRKQVQHILEALDSAMSRWDQEHPELFYQTLELNFPELLRGSRR